MSCKSLQTSVAVQKVCTKPLSEIKILNSLAIPLPTTRKQLKTTPGCESWVRSCLLLSIAHWQQFWRGLPRWRGNTPQ